MRRWLKSRQYPDVNTLKPMLEVMYYDDFDFEFYIASFKLSSELAQEINATGFIGHTKIEDVDTLFDMLDERNNSFKLIDNKKYDIDITSIESEVQDQLNDIKSLGLTGFKSYDTYYEMILENIKLYRRGKNINNLI